MKKALIILMIVVMLTNSFYIDYASAENKFFTEGGYGGGGGAEALTISGLLTILVSMFVRTNGSALQKPKDNVVYLEEVLKNDLRNNKPPLGGPPKLPYFDDLSMYIVRKLNKEQTLKEDILNDTMSDNLDDYVVMDEAPIRLGEPERRYIQNKIMEFQNIDTLNPGAPILLERDQYLMKYLSEQGYDINAVESIPQTFLDKVGSNDYKFGIIKDTGTNQMDVKVFVMPKSVYYSPTENMNLTANMVLVDNHVQESWYPEIRYILNKQGIRFPLEYLIYNTSLNKFTTNTWSQFTYNFMTMPALSYDIDVNELSASDIYQNIIYTEEYLSIQYNGKIWTRMNNIPIGGTIASAKKPWKLLNEDDEVIIHNNRHLRNAFNGKTLDNKSTDDVTDALEEANKEGKKQGEPVLNNIETDVNMDNEPVTGNILQRVLTWLFKPRADKLEGAIAEIQETFDDQAGLLTYPLTLVIEFLMKVGNLEPGDCIITIPPINYKGHELFGGTSFNFTEFVNKQEFNGIYVIYIFIVDFIMILGFLNLAAKKGDEIIRGN